MRVSKKVKEARALENIQLENAAEYDRASLDTVEIEDYKANKKPAIIHTILLNRTIRVVVLTAIVAICLPTFVYLQYYSRELSKGNYVQEYGTCGYYDVYHLPCGLKDIKAETCELRDCCYMDNFGCYHSLPARHRYQISGINWKNNEILLPANNYTPLEERSIEIKLNILEINENILEITVYDPTKANEIKDNKNARLDSSRTNYNVKVFEPNIYIEVYRKESNTTIFSTARGPLLASSTYFEWSIHLNADYMMGFGAETFLKDGDKFLLFNNMSEFSAPFVIGYNNGNRKYHAVYFSSQAMLEVEVLGSIQIRTIKSSSFKIHVLVGATPDAIFNQMKLITNVDYNPKQYWNLGVHLCNNDIRNLTQSISELKNLLENEIGKPFDSHCLQENLFWITGDPAVPTEANPVIKLLKDKEKRFIVSVTTPLETGNSLAYESANKENLLIISPITNKTYIGEYANKNVSYIDFTASNIDEWLKKYWMPKISEIDADGILFQGTWFPDEKKSEGVPNHHEYFVYVYDHLNDSVKHLVPFMVKNSNKNQLLLFNQNAIPEIQIQKMIKPFQEEKFFITTTPSINLHGESILQNVNITWKALRKNIYRLPILYISGISTNVPVCGDVSFVKTIKEEELCIRWYQFASVTSLFRVNSDRYITQFSAYAERTLFKILQTRYSLLEYIHSTLLTREPLLRPLFYNYPSHLSYAENFTYQFMVGDALMCAPVSLPLSKYVTIYFPDTFYELWSGTEMKQTRIRKNKLVNLINFPVVLSDFPIFIRSGYIVVLHNVTNSLTVDASRITEFYLKIALKCNKKDVGKDEINDMDEEENTKRTRAGTVCSASGNLLFSDDGTLWKFDATETEIIFTFESNDFDKSKQLFCSQTPTISNIIAWADIYGHPTISEKEINPPAISVQLQINVCERLSNEPHVVTYNAG